MPGLGGCLLLRESGPGGCLVQGKPAPGRTGSRAVPALGGRVWRPAPGGVWRPLKMATAAGGMHPTEMHSSFIVITVTRVFNCGLLVHSTC